MIRGSWLCCDGREARAFSGGVALVHKVKTKDERRGVNVNLTSKLGAPLGARDTGGPCSFPLWTPAALCSFDMFASPLPGASYDETAKWSCDQMRKKIATFIASKEMTQTAFLKEWYVMHRRLAKDLAGRHSDP